MVKAVFFDFWGTLVENGTYSPLRQTYKALRVRMPFGEFAEKFEKVYMLQEFPDQTTAFKAVCDDLNIRVPPFVIDNLVGIWNKNKLLAKLYPETLDVLKMLKEKGLKIAIVSNAPANNVEPLIERFGLNDFVDASFVSYKEEKLKTEGLFDVALKKLKLKAADVISVGDSIETDIRGAELSGIKSILIDRKNKREHENKILSLTEIDSYL